MIKISNYDLIMDGQIAIENININFGHETYLLAGHMNKRKAALINEIANSYAVYNEQIQYLAESGIVYLPNHKMLIENLTVRQNIEFFARFFRANASTSQKIISHFEIDNIMNRYISSLSPDHIQIVRIICAFHNTQASVYLLENLFADLNQNQISQVKDYLLPFRNQAIIIIAKTNAHQIEEFNPRVIKIENKNLCFEEQ